MKPKKQKTSLELLLDFLGKMSATTFFIAILMKVWTEEDIQWILNRIWLSALIIFFASFFLFGLCYYDSEKEKQ